MDEDIERPDFTFYATVLTDPSLTDEDAKSLYCYSGLDTPRAAALEAVSRLGHAGQGAHVVAVVEMSSDRDTLHLSFHQIATCQVPTVQWREMVVA